jgi:aldose 1-epimerase
MLSVLLVLLASLPAAAQRYAARQDGDVVRLDDRGTQTSVSLLPSVGNIAFDMTVNGHKVLRWPYASVEEFKGRPTLSGIPFLGPWANRLDEQAFYANGKKYTFDMELGNVRGAIPIHGFLTTGSRWQVVTVQADGESAWVTSRLEFYRNPLWMKQFPFAHTIEMTHRVRDGVLQVTTRIHNLSTEPMPVSIGFHPYFTLTDSRRDEWTIAVGAKTQWLLAPNKIPTGETEPIERLFPDPTAIALKDHDLDHVFSDLIRDGDGRAVMTVKGKTQQIDVLVGPRYRAMVIYAPRPAPPPAPASTPAPTSTPVPAPAPGPGGPGQPPSSSQPDRNFICFEPMAGITDAMNLSHKGRYQELQSIPPGEVWEESFWVRPKGFAGAGR